MSFWTAFVVVVAIIASTVISLGKQRAKSNEGASNTKASELEKEIEVLKERIATLEKIVTEPSYDLKKQFRDLESDQVA